MFRASMLAIVLATSAIAAHADEAVPAQTVLFKSGTSSSGWIDFTTYTNLGLYLPIRVNGHDAMAWLWGGPSNIDSGFAASIGLQAESDAGGPVPGVEVQLGGLTVRNASVKPDDLQAQAYAELIGAPLVFRLGEEVFNQVAVDIDFARHRVAFRSPKSVTKPAGAIELPLAELDGERVVPVAVDGAAPAQFELELGNMIGPLMVTPGYAESHNLLSSHRTSQRLSGRYSETVVSVDRLNFAGIDFRGAPAAIIPDTELPPASIAGGVGLPLLARFRLIIDYSHNRIYAVPNIAAVRTPIEKDRIGLVLGKKDNDFWVAFVAPNSPAESAGFKKGDRITLVDGKPYSAWPRLAIIRFQMADAGAVHAFTMADGSERQLKAADFF